MPRGDRRRLYGRRKAETLPRQGFRLVVIHKSEFTAKADEILRDRDRDIVVVRARLARPEEVSRGERR